MLKFQVKNSLEKVRPSRNFRSIFASRTTYRTVVSWALLICMLFIVLGVCPDTVSSQQLTPRRAVITSLEGSVMVQSAGQAVVLPARRGMELKTGDLIITGRDGTVEIRFDDGSISRIAPNSRVDLQFIYREGINSFDSTTIQSSWGRFWNNIRGAVQRNSRFEVNTPATVAGVRGTLFFVRVEGDGVTLVRVYDGFIGARSSNPGEELLIEAFQQAVFVPGETAPAEADPIDFSDIDDFELMNLLQDSPEVFVELIKLAIEQNEAEFLQRVNELLGDETVQELLGEYLEVIQGLLEEYLGSQEELLVPAPPRATAPRTSPRPAPDPSPPDEPEPDLPDEPEPDPSEFEVSRVEPGDVVTGELFELIISGARDTGGHLLDGNYNVTVTSSNEEVPEVFNAAVPFAEGRAAVPLTLVHPGSHNLTVAVEGVTQERSLRVNVVEEEPELPDDPPEIPDPLEPAFDVTLAEPGEKAPGIPFSLNISGVENADGNDVSGDFHVTVISDLNGTVHDGPVTFTEGNATVSVALNSAGFHTLTVHVSGIPEHETVDVEVIVESDTVYSFGRNAAGELGLGDTDIRLIPTGSEALSGVDVRAISAGEEHSLVLLENGDVYSFGNGGHGRLGHGDFAGRETPTRIEALTEFDVLAISAGEEHSLVLLENGDVYSFGRNQNGQLGLGDTESRLIPTRIEGLSDVRAISAGVRHSLVLLENGDVYSFGYGWFGQLGHGDRETIDTPTRIEALSEFDVQAVSAGGDHSLVLLENGDVYSFGRNGDGRLGHGDTDRRDVPTRIEALDEVNVQAIAAGSGTTDGHSLVLLEDGDVYSFGSNGASRLGLGVAGQRETPTLIEGLSGVHVQAIAAGRAHSLALLENGDVYSFGWGWSGQLGHGDTSPDWNKSVPTKIEALYGVGLIAAGGRHSLVYTGETSPAAPAPDPDPFLLQQIAVLDTDTAGFDIHIAGDFAYTTSWASIRGLGIIDISNPTEPELVASFARPDFSPYYGLYVQGNRAYVAADTRGVDIIDVADPESPELVNTISLGGWNARDVCISDGFAYVANTRGGLEIIRLEDQEVVSSVLSMDYYVRSVTVQDAVYAYVSTWESAADLYELWAIDISDPEAPLTVGAVELPSSSFKVYAAGDCVYVGTINHGLQVVDVSDPKDPAIIGSFSTSSSVRGIYVEGQFAFVTDTRNGVFYQLDISNPAAPLEVGRLEDLGTPWGVWVRESRAFIVGSRKLRVVEVVD